MKPYTKTHSEFKPGYYRTPPIKVIDRGCGSLTCAQHLARLEELISQLAQECDRLRRENKSQESAVAA